MEMNLLPENKELKEADSLPENKELKEADPLPENKALKEEDPLPENKAVKKADCLNEIKTMNGANPRQAVIPPRRKNMDRKQLIDDLLANKTPSRVPVAFWHHFVSFHDHYHGDKPEIYRTVLNEQKKYIEEVKPDLVKIMSDGFFGHPSVCAREIESVEDLKKITSVGEEHSWIQKQIEYVKDICDNTDRDVYKFYNIFSPLQYIRLRFEEFDEDFSKFVRLFQEAPNVMIAAAGAIAKDTKILVRRLFEETKIDGIYYSVQSVQDPSFDHPTHQRLVEPLDLDVLHWINSFTDKVILHICGYGKYKNELSWYRDYPVNAFNWAIYSENVSLAKGKEIFNGKPVLGGFDNGPDSVLYNGSEAELRKEVHQILDETGTRGVALGADCTISADISRERLERIRAFAAEYRV